MELHFRPCVAAAALHRCMAASGYDEKHTHHFANVEKEPQKPVVMPLWSSVAACRRCDAGRTATGASPSSLSLGAELRNARRKVASMLLATSGKSAPPGRLPSEVTQAAQRHSPHLPPAAASLALRQGARAARDDQNIRAHHARGQARRASASAGTPPEARRRGPRRTEDEPDKDTSGDA